MFFVGLWKKKALGYLSFFLQLINLQLI